jgi:hypothetical protein
MQRRAPDCGSSSELAELRDDARDHAAEAEERTDERRDAERLDDEVLGPVGETGEPFRDVRGGADEVLEDRDELLAEVDRGDLQIGERLRVLTGDRLCPQTSNFRCVTPAASPRLLDLAGGGRRRVTDLRVRDDRASRAPPTTAFQACWPRVEVRSKVFARSWSVPWRPSFESIRWRSCEEMPYWWSFCWAACVGAARDWRRYRRPVAARSAEIPWFVAVAIAAATSWKLTPTWAATPITGPIAGGEIASASAALSWVAWVSVSIAWEAEIVFGP